MCGSFINFKKVNMVITLWVGIVVQDKVSYLTGCRFEPHSNHFGVVNINHFVSNLKARRFSLSWIKVSFPHHKFYLKIIIWLYTLVIHVQPRVRKEKLFF